jgi:hypothetical protein
MSEPIPEGDPPPIALASGWTSPRHRQDGLTLRLVSNPDDTVAPFRWHIVPPPTADRATITACPCCDRPMRTVRGAQLVANAIYPIASES